MLYLYFGNNQIQVRQKAFSLIETLTENPERVTRIAPDSYAEGLIMNLAQGASLFGGAEVVLLDSLGEEREIIEDMIAHVPLMAESANHFIVIEGALTAPQKKLFSGVATATEEFTSEKYERFNAFLLTDAFLRRDKKSLWLLLMEAWKAGLTNEEIIGVLFWQVKTLRLVERTKSAEEAGQKSFVYSKAKRALSSFKKGELDQISRTFLAMYHDGHLGRRDTALALERWVLTL